jgi:integrase
LSDNFSIQEMLEVLLGKEGKRTIRLRHKTNTELFQLFQAQIVLRNRSVKAQREARRILSHFQVYLGEFPPSPELADTYLAKFADRKPTTLYRYHSIIKTFMAWYGQELETKIRLPQTLPNYVEDDDIEKLKAAMRSKRTHKKVIERNLLIIDLACKAGLRREEISNLMVRDIDLPRNYLVVRQGKGMKDRIIDLTPSLHAALEVYLKGKSPEERIFNLSPSTISGIIRWAAVKAGVDIHTHSLRHFFGQRLIDLGVDIETVRRLMGHSSLKTTQVYLARSDKQRREAIQRLEAPAQDDNARSETPVILPKSDTKLHLKVREVALVGSSQGNYLVLLRLTFVNPSAMGKTVYHVGSGAPGKQNVSNPIIKNLEDNNGVRVTFSKNKKIFVDLDKEECLILPIDIPASESRSYWMPLQIQPADSDSVTPRAHLYLVAEDITGQTLAEFDDNIELKTYMVP